MGRWRRLEALTQHVVAKADTASATESQTHIPAGQLTSAPAGGVEQHQSTAPHPGRILTDDEKRSLYHNGFVIIRDVVRKDVVQRIHDEIENSPTNSNGRHAAPSDINSLVFESDLRSILTDLNGHWDRLEDWMWQPAYTPAPEQPIEEALTSPAQYSNGLHVDGRRAIGGPSAIYCDATRTMSIKPFQTFVFVSVSDLRPLGRGQTHVLPGAHIAMEEFFRWQQGAHGEVGSLGPGWNMEADPEHGLETARHGDLFQEKGGHKGIPTMVHEYFANHEESSIVGPDGKRVPKPVPLTLGPGDACIANFTIPHAGSKNETGPERKQTIFRLKLPGMGESIPGTEQKRNAESTLPLPLEEIELWRAHLTDIWTDWPGMRTIAAEERPKTEQMRAELREIFATQGPKSF